MSNISKKIRPWYLGRTVVGFLLTVCVLTVTRNTQAQGWMTNVTPDSSGAQTRSGMQWAPKRQRARGPGLKMGNLELHPGLGFEAGYDTNVFFNPYDGVKSGIIRVTPSLFIESMGAERALEGADHGQNKNELPTVAFRGGLAASYLNFLNAPVRNDAQADVGLQLSVLPLRPFSFSLFSKLGRGVRPYTQNPGQTPLNFGRIYNQNGINVVLGTPGRVLEGNVGYAFGLDYFEGQEFRYNSNFVHTGTAGLTWKFFPFTALVYRSEYMAQLFPKAEDTPLALVTDNFRMNQQVGINGAITPKLSLSALAGYAYGNFDIGDDFDGIIGNATLTWRALYDTDISAGYERSYNSTFTGNFFRSDQLFAKISALFGGSVLVSGQVGLGFLNFGRPITKDLTDLGNTPDRQDTRITGSLYTEYRILSWLALNATGIMTLNITEFEYLTTSAASTSPVVIPGEYNKLEAWLGLRAYY